jgi:hypothetical protein
MFGLLLLLVSVAALPGCLSAQTPKMPAQAPKLPAQPPKIITLKMLDSRSGKLIETSEFLIQVDHKDDVYGNWVELNDDQTGKLTLPPNASFVAAQAKYNATTDIYINCDSVRDKPVPLLHWYSVSEILTSGVVAPNGCSRHTAVAKPGQFVFFVRQRNWREQIKDLGE